jgi:ribonuclease HI
MDIINIFTDGSCLNNQNKINKSGGYGIFFGENDIRNKSIKLTGNKITNQVAELAACLDAIEIVKNDNKIIRIYTDSMYVINCITVWCKKWEKNNWINSKGKVVENLELIQKIYNYSKIYKVEFIHINSHMPEPDKNDINYKYWYGNMMADKLAINASKLIST